MAFNRDTGQRLNPQAREFKVQDTGYSNAHAQLPQPGPVQSRVNPTPFKDSHKELAAAQRHFRIVRLLPVTEGFG